MALSCGALKKMGFTEHDPPKKITGTCYIVRTYQINRIMKFDNDEQMIDSFNENTRFGIGNNISKIYAELIGIKDEKIDDYANKNGFSSPFLITVTTDNKLHQESCGWIKKCNGRLEVYNFSKKRINDKERFMYAFQHEEEQIKDLLDEYETPYLPAVICSFSSSDSPVTVKKIKDDFVLWVTPDESFFNSFRGIFDAECQENTKVVLSERKKELMALIEKSRLLNSTTSKFLFRSMQEDDKKIKFLFSWTALEVLINKTFESVSKENNVVDFPYNNELPEKFIEYNDSLSNLYKDKNRGRKISNVAQKFLYLSIYYWKFSYKGNYDRFKDAQEKRNKFIHGSVRHVNTFPQYTYYLLLIVNNIINATLTNKNNTQRKHHN